MSTTDIELEQKMKLWAEKNPLYKPYIDSPFLKTLYIQKHLATNVVDCVVEGKAKLTLMVAKALQPRPITLCKNCYKKVCDEEKCGREDYEEMVGRTYIGGDTTGEIKISVAPFKTSISPLEVDNVYVIEGTIAEFNNKLEIKVESAILADGTQTAPEQKSIAQTTTNENKASPEAIQKVASVMDLFDNSCPVSKFNTATLGLSPADLKLAMKQLGVHEDEEGNMVKE